MHIITPYNPWAPKGKKKTWQEKLWEEQQIAELEAQVIAEASSRSLPQNAPPTSVATAGPTVNAPAGGGGKPVYAFFHPELDVVDFSATPLTGNGPLTVRFTNLTATPQFDTYLWKFGDGTTSTAISPTHVYNTGSTATGYTVQLTASYVEGTPNSASKVAYISASIPTVTAHYTFTTSSNTSPYSASFTNTSTNTSQTPVTTYLWTLKNGDTTITTSVATSPSFRIATGPVTASLQATGSYGIANATSSMWRAA